MERTRLARKIRSFALVIVVLLIGATVALLPWTEMPAKAVGGPGRYSLVRYFPLDEGVTWNYLQTYQDGHKDFEVSCIGGTEEVDDGTAKKRWEFDSGELAYYDHGYECMAWTKEGLKIYKAASSDGFYSTYDPPLIYLPRSIRLGETYTTNTTTETEYDASGAVIGSTTFTWTLTLEAEENIRVPAGNFSDCLRLSRAESPGGAIDETFWLAQGIGEVRSEVLGDEERELISFTERGTTYHPTD